MQIDWFTFIAQIVNFLIVLALLKRFLFGPVMRAMAERQAKIAASFAEAERQTEQARQEGELFREQRHELETERGRLLDEAKAEAAEMRQALLAEARQEIEVTRARWFASIEHQRQEILQELRTRVGERVVQIARGALQDLARADLEQLIIAVFLDQLKDLELSDSSVGSPAYDAGAQTIRVRSTFALPEPAREEIVRALHAHFTTVRDTRYDAPPSTKEPPEVTFEIAEDLVCGIEVQMRHRRVTWNVRDYLHTLEDTLEQAFLMDGVAQEEEKVSSQDKVAAYDYL